MVRHNLRMAMIRKQKKICPNSRARMEEFGSHAEIAQLVEQLTRFYNILLVELLYK